MKVISHGPHPTRGMLRSEAEREVTIRAGDQRDTLRTTQAVIRALAHKAMQGGVFAQRTFLELMLAEDERREGERRVVYEYWREHECSARAEIARAEARGEEPQLILPHPDDLLFDYARLEVEIVGPCDEREAQQVVRSKRLSMLCYELSVYHQEVRNDLRMPREDWRIGVFMMSHIALERSLPPRLRGIPDDYEGALAQRMIGRTSALGRVSRE